MRITFVTEILAYIGSHPGSVWLVPTLAAEKLLAAHGRWTAACSIGYCSADEPLTCHEAAQRSDNKCIQINQSCVCPPFMVIKQPHQACCKIIGPVGASKNVIEQRLHQDYVLTSACELHWTKAPARAPAAMQTC